MDMNEDRQTTIGKINTVAGNVSNQGWSAADHQIGLIQSELKELTDAIDMRDIHETRDGIGDVLFTVYGLAHRLGLNALEDLQSVISSNWSKFDTTEEDAEKTKHKYLAWGVESEVRRYAMSSSFHYYVLVSAFDQKGTDGKNYPKGKYLKSWRFQEPVFNPLSVSNKLLSTATKDRDLTTA